MQNVDDFARSLAFGRGVGGHCFLSSLSRGGVGDDAGWLGERLFARAFESFSFFAFLLFFFLNIIYCVSV